MSRAAVSMRRAVLSLLTALLLLFLLPAESNAAVNKKAYDICSDIVYTYKMEPETAKPHVRQKLAELKDLDASLGNVWEELMDYWFYVNDDLLLNYDCLPVGLPQDESLCIIVLGYQLNPDGSMAEELIGRCTVALECAKAYPKAVVIVTGGGTAYQHRDLTEAGQMADWLIKNGLSEDRILVEDLSQTTVQNAQFVYELLRQKPEIRAAAIVTSDYHVPLGCLLFQEQFLLSAYAEGTVPLSVFTNAAYRADSLFTFPPRAQALDLWSIAETILFER